MNKKLVEKRQKKSQLTRTLQVSDELIPIWSNYA